MPKTIAAIDVGTNSFHLLIVRPEPKRALKFRVIEHLREVVRLGSGSSDMKRIAPAAQERAIESLRRFKRIANANDAVVRAIGTSAVREALNQAQFIADVKKATGITIEAVSGFEEARFIYLGILQRLQVYNQKIVLLHIGGGSSEILVGARREILYDNCIKLGAIRMTDRFFPGGKIRPSSVEKCRKYVQGMLEPIERAVGQVGFETAIGSSGTILAVARMALASSEESASRLNGIRLSRKKLLGVINAIASASSPRELAGLPGVDPERTDILLGGAIILEQFLLRFHIKELLLSEGSLKEGVVLDTVEKIHRLSSHRHLHDLRRRSVESLCRTFAAERNHARHVAALSLRLFDELKRLHSSRNDRIFTDENRELLEYAAILHDIGFFLSHSQHHRHSYYLIRNAELLGFTEREKAIIANIARYHRKSHPKEKHEWFAELERQDRAVVLHLASILRIADGLDRSHAGLVRELHCSGLRQRVECTLIPRHGADLSLELWGAERKAALFAEVFKKPMVLKAG